jgi:serine O-acetyltransferase
MPAEAGVIQSKADYLRYLEEDRRALGMARSRPRAFGDEIWRFQRLLRRLEYRLNCRRSWFSRPLTNLLRLRFKRASCRLGYTIPPNVFGPGLSIAHRGTIVVNDGARVGSHCRIHVCVNIGVGARESEPGAPRIGDRVYIGPGAKIFGAIEIGDDVAIGANAVVNRSFPERGITIAGVPARKIADRGSQGMLAAPAG